MVSHINDGKYSKMKQKWFLASLKVSLKQGNMWGGVYKIGTDGSRTGKRKENKQFNISRNKNKFKAERGDGNTVN